MIYSRSSEYAIRACVHLSRIPPGKCVMAREIAQKESIPTHFLAKILQGLARKGLLRSTKGPSGGFCLEAPDERLNLLQIVSAVDGVDPFRRCVAGLPICSDEAPCPMHARWTRLRGRILRYLEKTNVHDLARSRPPRRSPPQATDGLPSAIRV